VPVFPGIAFAALPDIPHLCLLLLDVEPPFKNRPVPLRPERRRKVSATEVVYEPWDVLAAVTAQFLADVAAYVEEEVYAAGTEAVVPAALEDN